MLTLSHSRQRSPPGSPPGKVFSWSCSSNFKFAAGSRLFTNASNYWLSGRFSGRIVHGNTTRWRSQLLLICAHKKTNLTDRTIGQCEILIKSYWILRSFKTIESVVQPYPTQSLFLKWDQLSQLLPQTWLPLTRTHQQLTEVHPERWSVIRRQPLCPRLPLSSSPLHWQQPHVQWGDQGELINKGHSNTWRCSGTVHTTTTLASHNNSTFVLLFIRHDERRGFQLLHGGFIFLFIKYHKYLNSSLTDSSASNDVSLIIQGYIEEWNSKFPPSQFSSSIRVPVIKLQLYRQLSDFHTANTTAGASKDLPFNDACPLTFIKIITSSIHFVDRSSLNYLKISLFLIIISDEPKSLFGFFSHRIRLFYVERSSEEGSPIRNNTPAILNSTELSGAMARETITIASIASPEPQIVTIDSDFNKLTFQYGFVN